VPYVIHRRLCSPRPQLIHPCNGIKCALEIFIKKLDARYISFMMRFCLQHFMACTADDYAWSWAHACVRNADFIEYNNVIRIACFASTYKYSTMCDSRNVGDCCCLVGNSSQWTGNKLLTTLDCYRRPPYFASRLQYGLQKYR